MFQIVFFIDLCHFLDISQYALTKRRTRTLVDTEPCNNPDQTSLLISSTNFNNDFDDDDDYESLQYQFSCYGYRSLKLFRDFMTKLNGQHELEYLLYQWVIGNQLVIKYSNRSEDKDFLRAFVSVFRVR